MKMKDIKVHDDEGLNLLAGVRGVYALAGVDFYTDRQQAPQFQVCPIKLYISKALDLDFKEDIEDNRCINALTKEYKDSIKNYNEQIKDIDGYSTLWSNDLGSSLEQIVCNFLSNDKPINQATKDSLDAKLQKYYNAVTDIINPGSDNYKYEEFGYIDGIQIYRRVK